jgi:GrpB-like predicted nucleotidyltransferase (UPF0157 family)
MKQIIVLEHDENWSILFQEESKKIKEIFKEQLIDIHHIGSTSVKGLKAKPIIDIMPVVKDIDKVDLYNEQMIYLGYECMGEYGIPKRRFFRKSPDIRTHHVHIFQEDNLHEINRHLAVRNYLRLNPEEVIRYGELKYNLAKKYPNDIYSYMNGKDSLVKELERKGLDLFFNHE